MRNGLRRGISAAILSAVAAMAPLAAKAETLADALVSAYRKSNLLEQNRALLRAADEDVAAQIATLRPTLDFIANYGYQVPENASRAALGLNRLTQTYSLQLALSVYDGGRRPLRIEAAKETVLATREALLAVEQDVLLTAVQAYFDVRSTLAFVELRQNNVRLITQELRAARDRFEVGEVTRTDVALAESRLAAARSELALAQGNLEVAREVYKAAVGRAPGTLQAPVRTPATASNLEEAKLIARRSHPAIRQAQREVTVADLNARIAERGNNPTVSMTVTRSTNDQQVDDLTAGLVLRQRLYNGGATASAERRAMAQRDANRASLHQTVLSVERSVGSAWSQVQIVAAQIQALDRQIEAARIAFEGTREEARLGARTTLDVLDAEQELLTARASRIDAVNNRYVAIYSLLSAMGLLTVEHLNLGITTYDPAAYYNAVKRAPAGLSAQGRRLDRVLESIGRQ